MGFWAGFKIVMTYFPEFLALIKLIGGMTIRGMKEHEIRGKFKKIDEAFTPSKAPAIAAGELDDVFRGRK